MIKELIQSKLTQVTFVVSMIFALYALYLFDAYSYQKERAAIQKISSSYASHIRNNLNQALSATYPLAALIRTQNGETTGFNELAKEMLPLYPGIASLQLQPDGILKHIVPLQGNEGAIGHNLLLSPDRTKEAFLARDTGKLTLAGPFELVQGGIGAAARLPIYLESSEGKQFWGFATALIRFPDILETSKLPTLFNEGIAYQLSKIHPDTGEVQIIASSNIPLIDDPEIFEIEVPNDVWHFYSFPVKGWRNYTALLGAGLIGFLFVLLTTLSSLLITRLKTHQKNLEATVTERTKQFRTIFEEAPLGVAVIDSFTGHIYDANPAYSSIVGRSIKELRSLDSMEITHPDDIQKYLDNMAAMNAGETSGFTMQKRYIQPDSSVRWINMTIAPMQVEDKGKPRHLCMTEDITEKKSAEAALQESRDLRLAHQGALLELAKEKGYTLEAALNRFTTVLAEQLHATRASIWLLNKDNTAITCKALYESGNVSYNEVTLESKEYPNYFAAIAESGFISASDAHHHPSTSEFSCNYLTPLGISSMLDAPIRIKGQTVGITCCEHTGPKRMWTLEEEDFSRSVSELCAQAFLEIEQQKSEEKLQLSARVFNDTHEGIIITDAEMNIIDVNPAFCDITGYSRDEVIGQNPRMLRSGKQSPEFYQDMWQQINEKGHWQGEVWNRTKNGELYAELLALSVLKDELDKVVNYVGIFTDITSIKQQQEQLSLMAHYDELTRLPNRALFTDRFNQAIAHSKRTDKQLAVCFLDLDNFKPVNDNYGHDVGDQLLIEVASRISSIIREEDTVSRQGGDEFALLLNDIESFSQCEHTLQRLHYALSEPYLIDGKNHKITASSGVTLYPSDNSDIDTLLRHADQAMYQAKLQGKHRYHLFNPDHDKETIQKHHRLDEIEQALTHNHFQLYYQPKVNMVTGDVFGAEALIRWIHPEKGLIPPLAFLPIIEGTQLEIQIGDWVIDTALKQMDVWKQQGIELQISVNIASDHLQSKDFFGNLDSMLKKYPAVDSQRFQLEILESSALGDLDTISTIIESCQAALGVTIALDDFGTGYSSLTHLRSLPANTIKIDQSFIRDMLDDPSDYTIVDGVIGLAESFNRKVIAEGVETTEHGLMLLVMGCEQAQGYSIAKPIPADDFPQWLQEYIPNQEWISCAHVYRTEKENRIKLFRLTSEHWKTNFINTINSSPDDIEHWPIQNSKHCHCGAWIKRVKQEQLFEEKDLKQVEKTHEALHLVAHTLHKQYNDDDIESAREGLPKLQAAFDKMSNALGLCE
ncbi:MAG: EAL domain-containing protein [Methylococcaceae bacterium]|nr:EAL domain-containing protein [Methylococcaceae bacterium]